MKSLSQYLFISLLLVIGAHSETIVEFGEIRPFYGPDDLNLDPEKIIVAIDVYGDEDGALHRLVDRTVAGLNDPTFFSTKTGVKQTWVGKLSGGKLAWMEAYYSRYPTPEIKYWIDIYRPMKNRRVGGNATLLYGAR